MLNIHELEKRWKVYKIKSFLPYVIIAISLIIITCAVYIFYNTSTTPTTDQKISDVQSIPAKEPIITKAPVVIKEAVIIKKEIPIQKVEKKNTTTPKVLEPSLGFMQNMHYEVSQKAEVVKKKVPKEHTKRIKKEQTTEVIEDVEPVVTTPKEKKVAITIERKETQNDIFEIISRFKKNNNPALSLFVAKKYYELGNYEQAYNYALITNQINSNIEASWIIFAKALVKLHKRDKAIYTLQEYIKVSHSSNAEILLNEIKAGKFK